MQVDDKKDSQCRNTSAPAAVVCWVGKRDRERKVAGSNPSQAEVPVSKLF